LSAGAISFGSCGCRAPKGPAAFGVSLIGNDLGNPLLFMPPLRMGSRINMTGKVEAGEEFAGPPPGLRLFPDQPDGAVIEMGIYTFKVPRTGWYVMPTSGVWSSLAGRGELVDEGDAIWMKVNGQFASGYGVAPLDFDLTSGPGTARGKSFLTVLGTTYGFFKTTDAVSARTFWTADEQPPAGAVASQVGFGCVWFEGPLGNLPAQFLDVNPRD
jgi:hypothetical protein